VPVWGQPCSRSPANLTKSLKCYSEQALLAHTSPRLRWRWPSPYLVQDVTLLQRLQRADRCKIKILATHTRTPGPEGT
jgi:hypothetical protein